MTAELRANLQHIQLSHLIRAHSLGGNSSDRSTYVHDAAFELDPSVEIVGTLCEPLTYTNLVATCGLNILNLIDTETGKIVKRFSDDVNKSKEVNITFFLLFHLICLSFVLNHFACVF